MLDIVLYRHDRRGRLVAEEREFGSLRSLARFFLGRRSIPWEWAEVTHVNREGRSRIVRYSAEELRTPLDPPSLDPSAN